MDSGDLGLDTKIGMVHPVTDAYAAEAVEALKAGKVIAVPTDTLYGFACDACSLEAVNRIYEIKGRKHTSPLAICVGDVSDIDRFAVTNHLPHGLLDSLLPGPVTVVLKRGESSVLERSLNPGLDSIGVRVPDCNFIRIIARGSGTTLALTSANLSGQPSSVCIKILRNSGSIVLLFMMEVCFQQVVQVQQLWTSLHHTDTRYSDLEVQRKRQLPSWRGILLLRQ